MSVHGNQTGFSTAILLIIAAVVVVGGGVAAYVMTDGFGTQTDEVATSKQANSTKETAKATSDADDDVIPAGFPASMPIYPSMTIITSSTKDDGGYRLGLNTKDHQAEVIEYYQAELAKAGWNPETSIALANMLKVSKDQWTGSVTIVESKTTDTGTTISYILDKK